MPFNEDGSRKRSNLYKKSSGFKMKSPLKDHEKEINMGYKLGTARQPYAVNGEIKSKLTFKNSPYDKDGLSP